MAVVTPCQEDGDIVGSKWACASKWVWMSTKPGVTMHPVDHAVGDFDVGCERWDTGAVDHAATADDEVGRCHEEVPIGDDGVKNTGRWAGLR